MNPFSKSKFNLSEAHALESVRNPEKHNVTESTVVDESSLDKQPLQEMISSEASAAISDSDLHEPCLESQIAEAQLNWDSFLENEAQSNNQNEIVIKKAENIPRIETISKVVVDNDEPVEDLLEELGELFKATQWPKSW